MAHYVNIALFFILGLLQYQLGYGQTDCTRQTLYGSAELCLPQIKGMTECYTHPDVKQIADHFEDAQNLVLGYYLNDSNYQHVDSLYEIRYEDYFKIYASRGLGEMDVDIHYLASIYEEVIPTFRQETWVGIKESIEEKLEGLNVGTPQLVEEIELTERSRTMTMIINYQVADESFPVAMTINFLVLNKRLIFVAYYLNYVDEHTFAQLADKTRHVIQQLELLNPE